MIGRPITDLTRDSETKAGAATRRVEEAIDSETNQQGGQDARVHFTWTA